MSIHTTLTNKSAKEKANIKGTEIANLNLTGEYIEQKYGLRIEIQSISKIEGGIEILARAWKDGKQLGFGADGSVEIERFRIFNPPIMVPDGTKSFVMVPHPITRVETLVERVNFKEDLSGALRESLAHTINIVAKDGKNIVPGKIGNTTSTFYPDAGKPGTSSVDGNPEYANAAAYATAHDAATGTIVDGNGTAILYHYNTISGGTYYIARALINWDTSAIPDGDTVSSATISLMPKAINSTAKSTAIVTATGASDNDYTTADYDGGTTTRVATDVAWTAYTLNAYYDFSLNASGIAQISKTAASKFFVRTAADVDNTAPTTDDSLGFYSADTAGTTSDPKLVVVHSVAALSISVSDQLNVTESVSITQINNISVSDQLNVTESVTLALISNISVSDQLNITESVSIYLDSFFISVSDQLTITDAPTVSRFQETELVSVSDQLDISESVQMEVNSTISVNDQVTVSESVSRTLSVDISVSDQLNITESVTVGITINLSVYDQLDITESVTKTVSEIARGLAKMRGNDNDYPLGMSDQTVI